MLPLSEPKGISCGVLEVFIAAIKIGLFQPLRCKGSAFFANKQDLCAFAHADEVSVRENQRIRRRNVHGGYKGNKPPAFCIPLVYLWYRINYLRIRRPEGVRRNALRVQRPKSPHFEESAQA